MNGEVGSPSKENDVVDDVEDAEDEGAVGNVLHERDQDMVGAGLSPLVVKSGGPNSGQDRGWRCI